MVSVLYSGVRFYLFAHRVVWLLAYGDWPKYCIDHVNRNRSDNRLSNLRDVPQEVNMRNNAVSKGGGLTGAYRTRFGRYMSRIYLRGTPHYLGVFDTAEAAHEAFLAAKATRPPDGPRRDYLTEARAGE